MIDCIENYNIPDEDVVFYDGFLYIITRTYVETQDFNNQIKFGIDVICLHPEYDDPISLKDIEQKYPNVCKVIHEDWLKGSIYNYGNHKDHKHDSLWERSGTTVGFA